MKVKGKHYRTIWLKEHNPETVQIIDQTKLPHKFQILDLRTVDEMAAAIREMYLRGAGLIGAAAGYGIYLASLSAPGDPEAFEKAMTDAADLLIKTRPTAKNLEWAVNKQLHTIASEHSVEEKRRAALHTAVEIADFDAEACRQIGLHGMKLIEEIAQGKKGEPVNILTHCNAGWLAFVDYGSATAPIYAAHDRGIPIHVWVDETRPRNQGASLTAWELGEHGVPHTLIVDNTGGHLMQHGMVDLVIVGSDRTTVTGDVANKIGTYLKALAAKDNGIPFYAALPSSTFDWGITDGIREIPIEERDPREVKYIHGNLICPLGTPAKNYGFDVTPARLVTGLITERGICQPNRESILKIFPEKR
ncbi:MAG: S-methyl-5-thioribose-1-phosphate isomerase [Spirochaetales bacterium]|nr:S-methyl-5-thioribose-1-phosphate isomerase [Spirochaetales bacterium]